MFYDPNKNRALPYDEGKKVMIQHDRDFVSTVYYANGADPVFFMKDEHGQFTIKHEPGYKDWYMIVAIEKLELITADRHLIDKELLMQYRWAIREGYNHQLDSQLRKRYDRPNNRNTIAGVRAYIERIQKASKVEMAEIEKQLEN